MNYWAKRYMNDSFTGARFYLVVAVASVFGILNYHFCYNSSKAYKAVANGWISLLFQVLMVGIFFTQFGMGGMTNFDLLHGLALGYYIACLLFYQNKISMFYHIVIISLLILNAYYLTGMAAVGDLNFPIMLLCIYKCGDLMSDITYLLILYESIPDVIILALIFQIFAFIYTHFYLVVLLIPSTFRTYNLLALITSVMSGLYCIGQIVNLYKRLTV